MKKKFKKNELCFYLFSFLSSSMEDLIKTTKVSPINFVYVLIVSLLMMGGKHIFSIACQMFYFRRFYRDFYRRRLRIEEEIDGLTDGEHIEFVKDE